MEIAVSLVFIILAAVFFGIHEKKTEDKPEQEPAMKREADQEMRGVGCQRRESGLSCRTDCIG